MWKRKITVVKENLWKMWKTYFFGFILTNNMWKILLIICGYHKLFFFSLFFLQFNVE